MFKGKLRSYQEDFLKWLRIYRSGILTAPTGLGKTIMGIATMVEILEQEGGNALVICPSSIQLQWLCRLEEFSEGFKLFRIHGSRKQRAGIYEDIAGCSEGKIIIATWPQMWSTDFDIKYLKKLKGIKIMLLDESHNMKNVSLQSKQVLGLIQALKPERRILLTATPTNFVEDLYRQVRAVDSKLLGSWEQFRDRYLETEDLVVRGGRVIKKVIGVQRMDEFIARLANRIIYRITFADAKGELPEIIENDIPVPIDPIRSVLSFIANEILQSIRDDDGKLFGWLAVLQEALTDTSLIRQYEDDEERFSKLCEMVIKDPSYKEYSIKLETVTSRILELLEQFPKLMVYSYYPNFLKKIAEFLDSERLRYAWYKSDNDNDELERSKEEDCPVLLMGACGREGLDINWIPAMLLCDHPIDAIRYTQLTGRLRRLNSSVEAIYVERIIAEKVGRYFLKLLNKKIKVLNTFTGGDAKIDIRNDPDLMDLILGLV